MSEQKNAFSLDFLRRLEQDDEFGPADEAEFAGPWKVIQVEGGFGLFEYWQDLPVKPIALFQERATASKFAAALSAAGREPQFRHPPQPDEQGRFPILSSTGQVEGWTERCQDRLLELAHMADFCARSPLALAAILRAAGSATIRKAGQILMRECSPARD